MLDYPLVTPRTPIGATVAYEHDVPPFQDLGTLVRHRGTQVGVTWQSLGSPAGDVMWYRDDELQVLPPVRPAIFTGSAGR